ncbi:Roadblock/LC7 family protein [Methanothermus fervidus DSM 2088]|uniref:Roadblock/LC7 family protein n=1 Tax=Methanothermus fervidus (strain ATCC 43054 / DSM 2088 / JCM 10308 / V24 S) TaxID=523846 RepID=E3GXS4_METFV|nr:roadblock/LC7 domain-containing protein [Methanothermus fervidus]ADP77106.1 Roadblock/LC7 family protein [Methanothermus fervidus DSM 2088]
MISRVLRDLTRIDGVNGSLVVGKDGLIIESELGSDMDAEIVAARSSVIFGAAKESVEELKQEPLEQVMIEGSRGKMLMKDVGEGILVVLTDEDVNLGLIRLEMRRSAERIKDFLK